MTINPNDYRGCGADYANATVHPISPDGMFELQVTVRFHKDVFLKTSMTNPVVSNLADAARDVAGRALLPFHPNRPNNKTGGQ